MSNPNLFRIASMPENRKNKGKGKEVEVVVGLASHARQRDKTPDESLTQISPTPGEPGNSEVPLEPPIYSIVQDLRNAV